MSARGWRLAAMTVGVLALVAGFILFGLPTDDVPRDPDVVVVLGGGGPDRAELGIELAERFGVPLVLASTAASFGERQGRSCEWDAICFKPDPDATRGEARMVTEMAAEQDWEHVTVVTSTYHANRSRYLFRQCLGAERVSVVGSVPDGDPTTTLFLLVREHLGMIAGATIQRAC